MYTLVRQKDRCHDNMTTGKALELQNTIPIRESSITSQQQRAAESTATSQQRYDCLVRITFILPDVKQALFFTDIL